MLEVQKFVVSFEPRGGLEELVLAVVEFVELRLVVVLETLACVVLDVTLEYFDLGLKFNFLLVNLDHHVDEGLVDVVL